MLSSILYGASVPYDPELGEGNSRAIAAQFGAVAAFFSGVAVACVGLYLKSSAAKTPHEISS